MVYVDSLIAYVAAWLGAFLPSGRAQAPLTAPRLAALALFPVFLVVQALNIVFLAVDHVLFPAFRGTRIRQPVFIVGVPRSGTTFLHRRLAVDGRFTAPQAWEVLAAPSLSLRYLLRAGAGLDRALGRPLERLLRWLTERSPAKVDEVHPLGLREAEEDYLALLPAAGCFFAYLMFPHAAWFRDLARLDALPQVRRERLLQAYHRLLQRQVYFHGGAQLLSKNAAFASWVPYLHARYPDALIILCVREPAEALASQLTSLREARALFSTFPDNAALECEFSVFYREWYAHLASFAAQREAAPLVVEQEWLRGNTEAVLEAVYARLQRAVPGASQHDTVHSGAAAGSSRPQRQSRRVWEPDAGAVAAMQSDYLALRERALQRRTAAPCS
jgi:hypothetical protein